MDKILDDQKQKDEMRIRELILELLPSWHYKIAKPFKKLQDEGVSLEMYYTIKTLQWSGGELTMSEVARLTKTPKQQMTKLVNRLVEQKFVERVDDPQDRRVVKIRLTDAGQDYNDRFLENNDDCFQPLLDKMDDGMMRDFLAGLELLDSVFLKLPCDCTQKDMEGDT